MLLFKAQKHTSGNSITTKHLPPPPPPYKITENKYQITKKYKEQSLKNSAGRYFQGIGLSKYGHISSYWEKQPARDVYMPAGVVRGFLHLLRRVKMKNRLFTAGMLALVLAFGMAVVGCDNPAKGEEKYTYTFLNQSSVTVTVSCSDLDPSNFTIDAGSTKTATSSQSKIQILYTPADKVNVTGGVGTFTFKDNITANQVVKPAAPSGLAAGTITSNSIAVTWNTVSGASGYTVYAGTTSGNMTQRGTPTAASFTITGLSANTLYYIAVSAKNTAGEGVQSSPITATTAANPSMTAPLNLLAGTITSNSIAVTWSAVSGASGYTVYAGTTSGNMTQQGTAATASYTITGLTANTLYYIAVSARDASGEGRQSSPITARTVNTAAGSNVPTGLVAEQITNSSIKVAWNAVSGAVSYKVYRSSSAAGSYANIGTASDTSFNDTGLAVSTDYYYKVSAVTAGDVESGLSEYILGRIAAQTKAITQFRFADFSVNGTISGSNISVTVPNIVNLTTLTPTIVHDGKSINPAPDAAQNFSSPVQYTVTADDGTFQSYTVTVTVTNTGLASAFTWINSNAQADKTYTIIAQASESLAPVTINPSYGSVSIILSGGTTEKTISLSSNGSLFTISKGSLTLENNITLSGRDSNTASLVRVNSSSTLVMKTGSKIQNNTVATANNTDAFGGGVYINNGTFTMDGGTISGNKVQAGTSGSYSNTVLAKGGGVYFYSGTFTMNGGTISNNTAYSAYYESAGGGVYVDNTETFTMNGGTISGNTAESSSILATSNTYGGGVAAWSSSTFTMTGGTISGNTVKTASNQLGGGVYVRSDKFTKTGGTINGSNASPATSQNTAKDTNSGHAVYALVGSATLKRNTTAGTTVNMDSSRTGSAGGWE